MSGGTLEGGCLQEEIRFSLSPELLVARLVLEPLEDNEAAIITVSDNANAIYKTQVPHIVLCVTIMLRLINYS